MASGGVVTILTPGGQEMEIPFSGSDTVRALKEQILAKGDAGAVHLILLHGAEVLRDDWTLAERGIADGAALTQVVSPLPSGTFGFVSSSGNAPAGRNTSAIVRAVFQLEGACVTFRLSVAENEVTSLIIGPDWDPFASYAAFDQEYKGIVQPGDCGEGGEGSGTSGTLILVVSECQRKGHFRAAELGQLAGRLSIDPEALELEIYFAAGGCNEGTAGLRWLTLGKGLEVPIPKFGQRAGRSSFGEQVPAVPKAGPLAGPAKSCASCALL